MQTVNRRLFPILFFLVFILGCKQDPIVSYRVAKENLPASPPSLERAGAQSHREIEWTTPSGWKEQPPSSMRVASFLITSSDGREADVSVIPLSGEAGGDLPNINRWRDQLKLGPLSEGELETQSQIVQVGKRKMRLVNFVSEYPLIKDQYKQRILAAIFHQGSQSWFFKMMGEDVLVQNSKPAFIQFLSSLNVHDHE
ncbi:MAG: hypothetical protein KCHDKBKB_01427 [Elusimicrobia bacterium]|nr:hypothetical protein [Elusimicrobiota bacterium]